MTNETSTPNQPAVEPAVKVATKATPAQPKVATIPSAPIHTPAARVSPNVIQPSPTASTHTPEPAVVNDATRLHAPGQNELDRKDARERGYSLGPGKPPANVHVKNVHTNALNLESGIIEPGQTGFATAAEVSNFIGNYLEEV